MTEYLVAWFREFCRTVEIITRTLREVVTRVRLCGQGPRRGCTSLWVVGWCCDAGGGEGGGQCCIVQRDLQVVWSTLKKWNKYFYPLEAGRVP